MKRTVAFILALLTLAALASCKKKTVAPPEDTAAETKTETEAEAVTGAASTAPESETEPSTEASAKINSAEEAIAAARAEYGERDSDTGYLYSYSFEEITDDGKYKVRLSWYIEEDERYSTCGYLLVSPEGGITKFDW